MKNNQRPSRPKTASNRPPSAQPKSPSAFKPKDKPRGKAADTSTDSQSEKRPYKPKGARTDKPTERRTERPTERRTERPTERRTDKPTERRTDKPTERRTDKPTERPQSRPPRPAPSGPKPITPRPKSTEEPRAQSEENSGKFANPRPNTEGGEKRPKTTDSRRSSSSEGGRSRSSKPSSGRKSQFLGQKPVFRPKIDKRTPEGDDDMRLNKYVALCGVAARRKAAEMIQMGEVTVNGAVVTEPGHRVLPTDVVRHKGAILKPVEKMIYILLNKPKDTITTVTDERGRKTVMDLVSRTVKERIFPVGRLDRDTTGLLVLTNDGDLAQKLSHPSYRIKKFYHVVLNKVLTKNDLETISKGLELEDGVAEVDAINYLEGAKKDELMVEIHIGKNRIVRRIFESLGYEVTRLDRVYYGGLTKKDLPRGDYRSLTDREVIMLKHFTGK